MNSIERQVTMNCPVCGSEEFTYDDCNVSDDALITCKECSNTLTRGELIELNQEKIENEIEDVTDELVKKLQKEISKMFK